MIILCPKCSTGFNLPEKHITPRGAKLRCSKCSHVFRVRSGAGDEPEIFYKPEDEEANAAQERPASALEPVKSYAAPRRPMLDDEDEDDRVQAIGGATRMGLGVSHEPAGNGTQLGLGGGISEVSSPNHKTQFGSPGLAEVSSPNHRTQFGAAGLAARGEEDPGTMDLGPHLASGQVPALGAHTQFGPGSIAATREKSSPQLKAPPLGKIGGALDAISAGKAEPVASQTLEWRASKPEPTAQGLDLFGEEDKEIGEAFEGDDPFAGAFELSSSAALKKPKRPRSMLFDDQGGEEPPKDDILMPAKPGAARPSAAPAMHEGLGGASSFVELDPAPSTPRRAAALPDDVPEPAPAPTSAGMWSGGGQDAFGMDDMVDPSFGKDAPAFDPSRGVIEPTQTPAPAQAARPSPAQQATRPAPAPIQLASAGPQAAPRPQVAAAAAPAPHTIGGSGPQKAANMALIVLTVLFLFLGLLAALNDMMLDFKRFGHMLEVGFGGEPFKPRPEWLTGAAQADAPAAEGGDKAAAGGEVKAAAREALHVRGVWAQVAPWTKKKDALVVRGQVHNDDLQDYVEVRVKVQVVDGQGKVIAEQEAPVGAWVTDAQIKGLGPAKQPSTLMPEKPSKLATRGSEPFTVIFDEVPKGVEAGEQVGYRVEISKRVGEKDLMK